MHFYSKNPNRILFVEIGKFVLKFTQKSTELKVTKFFLIVKTLVYIEGMKEM